ncbi:DUF726 domain-containing protein [Vibrio sp. SM6]|uniref:DUF726 domain-containing protein n=1 Tax=Vibrio agarilyticus TaxID=2726741 RepID=A0A7X8YHW6_9VIBR|nr:DUF726 domain-containing protein [Vibrio agarilyticus]NLS13961.1 DUF726 domain-containing protein [Vibrio agarilyticus]
MTINIEKVRHGDTDAMYTIIVINGFLSEKTIDVKDWLNVLNERYKSETVLHCQWPASQASKLLFKTVGSGTLTQTAVRSVAKKSIMRMSLSVGSTLNPYLKLGTVAYAGVTLGSGVYEFRKAMKNAKLAGEQLATYLDSQKGNFILMGHSLGARVIFHCLENLQTRNRVRMAMLFGGAVGKENAWEKLFQIHPQLKIYNYHSSRDYVLKTLYPVGTFKADSPIGLHPIVCKRSGCVYNVDLTDVVSGHMEYKKSGIGQHII